MRNNKRKYRYHVIYHHNKFFTIHGLRVAITGADKAGSENVARNAKDGKYRTCMCRNTSERGELFRRTSLRYFLSWLEDTRTNK